MRFCPDCGFDFQPLIDLGAEFDIPADRVSAIRCPRCWRLGTVLLDDAQPLEGIAIGTPVVCKDVLGVGVIIDIQLSDAPFRVEWADGDLPDWFRGSQLRRPTESELAQYRKKES